MFAPRASMYGERSSPAQGFKPGGLITSKRFDKQYHAAKERYSARSQGLIVPYEYDTTALFEDLYNHLFFSGESFSNNSQQPPHNTSRKACDIVTRYWSPDDKSRTFLFTEAKREATSDPGKAELQLAGYCQTWLVNKDSGDIIFGATAWGCKIRFFLAAKSTGCKLESLCPYIEVKEDENECPKILPWWTP